MDASFKRFVTK